jgi:DNA-binding transcriptional ArsR family regulator
MPAEADLQRIGALLGDRVRATMLTALLSGHAQSASALAATAGASPSLTSAHLRKLLDGGLVTVEQSGRRRLYRLASPQVAELLEAVMLVAPDQPVASLRQANRRAHLRGARLCYDHLAGVLGVAVTEALVARTALADAHGGFGVTAGGEALFAELAVDVAGLRRARRPLTRACLDWTERRPHLAGGLGAALASALLERRWVTRRPGSRGLEVTVAGRQGLAGWIGLDVDGVDVAPVTQRPSRR